MRIRGSLNEQPIATYTGAHKRVYSERGPARNYSCAGCNGQAEQWALSNYEDAELDVKNGKWFSPHTEDYRPLCGDCHRFEDKARRIAARLGDEN